MQCDTIAIVMHYSQRYQLFIFVWLFWYSALTDLDDQKMLRCRWFIQHQPTAGPHGSPRTVPWSPKHCVHCKAPVRLVQYFSTLWLVYVSMVGHVVVCVAWMMHGAPDIPNSGLPWLPAQGDTAWSAIGTYVNTHEIFTTFAAVTPRRWRPSEWPLQRSPLSI